MMVGRADENGEVTVKYWKDEREREMIVKRLENRWDGWDGDGDKESGKDAKGKARLKKIEDEDE